MESVLIWMVKSGFCEDGDVFSVGWFSGKINFPDTNNNPDARFNDWKQVKIASTNEEETEQWNHIGQKFQIILVFRVA